MIKSTEQKFVLKSEYKPTGDQPQAIEALVKGFEEGNQCQTLLGVTGSGKTFTMANIIEKLNKPTLVIAHNKTLAAQFYGEFKEFFPDNAVEYFVSLEWDWLKSSVISCCLVPKNPHFPYKIGQNGLDDTGRYGWNL